MPNAQARYVLPLPVAPVINRFNILATRQPLNQFLVEFPTGSVIDVPDKSFRLVKAGVMNEPFQAIAPTVVIFNIHQHAEAVLKGDIFHPGVIHLGPKCFCHGREAHLKKFI